MMGQMTFEQKLISVARADIGVHEEPLLSNWGPPGNRVRAMIVSAGYAGAVYWCCCAVFDWMEQTCRAMGVKNPMPRTGDCDYALMKGRKAGLEVEDPQPGDQFFVMASPHDATHTGIVEAVLPGNRIKPIEGNSNPGGSRNGTHVVERDFREAGKLVFIRWANAIEDGWKLHVGSKTLDLTLVDGANIAPARDTIKALGLDDASLSYDSDTHALTYGGKPIPSRPQVRDGVSYVPVRVLAAFFGKTVGLDAASKTVTLS